MNIIDISVIVLLVLFGIFGAYRGLIRQLFFLGGLIAGHLIGIEYYALVVSVLNLRFKYAELVGYVIIMLAVYIVVFIVGSFIKKKIHSIKLSFVDRAFGFFAGVAKGMLLVILLVFVLLAALPRDAKVLRESIAVPYAIVARKWITKGFPMHISDSLNEKVQTINEKIRAIEVRPPEFFNLDR